jgi:hypothetical protein
MVAGMPIQRFVRIAGIAETVRTILKDCFMWNKIKGAAETIFRAYAPFKPVKVWVDYPKRIIHRAKTFVKYHTTYSVVSTNGVVFMKRKRINGGFCFIGPS